MRTLLLEPPRWNGLPMIRGGRCSRPSMGVAFPYWTASTAAHLETNGVEFRYIDANALDLSWNDVRKAVSDYKPDLVVFSASNCSIDFDVNAARIAKEVDSGIKTAIIEPIFAGAVPALVFKLYPQLDIALKGEPEGIVLELSKAEKGAALERIKGLYLRDGTKVVDTGAAVVKNIEALRMPAYHLLPLSTYASIGVRTSRGCPYNCTFCSLGASTVDRGLVKKMRYRDIKDVVAELRYLVSKGVRMLSFLDESFTINKGYVRELCRRITEAGLDISWNCETRADLVDSETLKSMKAAGCSEVFIGVESADEKILRNVKKNIELSDIIRAGRLIKSADLHLAVAFILGLPGENRDTIEKLIRLAIELEPDSAQFGVATPVVCTELFEQCKRAGWLRGSFEEIACAGLGAYEHISYPHLDTNQLHAACKEATLRLNSSYLSLKTVREAYKKDKLRGVLAFLYRRLGIYLRVRLEKSEYNLASKFLVVK